MSDYSGDKPTDDQLSAMSTEDLVRLGGKMDGVDTVLKEPRWPVEGTRAEKRSERTVAIWLLLGGILGFALLLAFLFWPWEYKPNGVEGNFLYTMSTPVYGLTSGCRSWPSGSARCSTRRSSFPRRCQSRIAMTGSPPNWIAGPRRPI